jgi:branched-chain amino acid transport system substrate-binding protein
VKLLERGWFLSLAKLVLLGGVLSLLTSTLNAQFVVRDHPVGADEIRIGMVNDQSGALGGGQIGIKDGCLAYFKRVNEAGGIYGRKLVLIDYDDRYEPLETVSATARLINDDKVFALLGYRGTATCDSVASMIREADITFFGPFTGSKRLREPSMSMVYCLRPSLAYEIAVVVDHLIRDLGTRRIAFFGQADSLGENGQSGLESALAGYDLKIAAVGKYVRNSVDLELALNQIVPASPDAIIMAATPQSAIDFLAEARRRGLRHTVFFMLSSIPIERFPGLTEADLDSLFLSKLVPSPQDSSIPCARAFRRDMRNFPREKLTYLSFEAYLGAAAFVAGLKAAGPDLSQASLRQALDHLDVNLGGFSIRFTPRDRTGSHAIFLNRVRNGRLEPVETLASPHERN